MNRGEEASVSGSADDELQTASTSQSNSEQQPKKGILKRPSINDEKRDKLFPLAGFRPSPDRFPEKGSTRIPKLQVTWWEKNAVAFIGDTSDENNTDSEQIMRDLGSGRRNELNNSLQIRQTAILDSEDSDMNEAEMITQIEAPPDLDDILSITSSTGSATSSVVGRWWTGKDTRYVPHCQKKGCNHANHTSPSEYITPTQRRNKELAMLKKELRQAISERDEKEQHLSDLRDKVKEIEIFNEAQSTLVEGQKMMRKEQMEKEALEKDLKIMEKRHTVRVNQLIQETMMAREELVQVTSRNAQLEALINISKVDMAIQTDSETMDRDFLLPLNIQDPSDPQIVPDQNAYISNPATPVASENIPSPLPSPHLISLISPDSKGNKLYCSQEALNHIQACQNEAFIWRNKAAQLEIVAKEQILKIEQLEEQLKQAMIAKPQQVASPQTQITVTKDALIIEDKSVSENAAENSEPIIITSCNFEACHESKNVMKNEIEHLRQTFNDAKTRIHELEDDINVLRLDLENADEERLRLQESLRNANSDIESKTAEIVASLNTANRLQQEKENMHQAIDYMEERMQVYRNTLQDHDLVVSDEVSSDWRKTMNDPRYLVMNSKLIQTTLTSQKLSEHESEFLNAQKTLHELKQEYSVKNSSLADKFKEVENILLTKSELVDTLTKQLEDVRKIQSKEIEEKQNERDHYKQSLEKVTLIAEKVPILESQLASLYKEKSEIEADHKKHMESYEDELATMLQQSLVTNKSQDDYWEEKLKANETIITKLKSENAGLQKELEDQKMTAHLQKADLQKKLISSIEHVENLQEKANKSQRDVECQAIPRQINKYVGCKPNVKHKGTIIDKGDLFDENEERLRICKSELETTRRQVTVLQQKLVSVIQMQTSQKVKKRIAVLEDNNKNKLDEESLEKKLREMELKNTEQKEMINTLEAEKFLASSMEKSRIQKLVNEFDNLREKLDQDMSNYSKEKQWLQWRISNLEKDNSELQKLINRNSQKSEESFEGVAIRKTMSEPDFSDDVSAEEKEILRISHPRNDNAKIESPKLINTSQPFSQLADVLNLVRSDLEQVLTEIDEPDAGKSKEASSQNASSPNYISASTDILNDVLSEWAEDERKLLERQLKRSQEERAVLKNKNNELSKDLQVAMAELNVYRLEKPHKNESVKELKRSSSFAVIDENNGADLQRWKEKSGTLFREVNRIRQELKIALENNVELNYQLALARGERELSSCVDRGFPISPSLSFHTAPDVSRLREKDEIVIHDTGEPFQFGSSKASLSCSIMIRSQSLERKSQQRESSRRSQSAHRKPPPSKEELSRRERRRERRLPKDISRSSSVTSLYLTPKEQQKLPIMSASWHEKASDLMDCDTDYDRRNIRVISLREKVGKLSRENKELQARLQYTNNINVDNSRILELERETEELKCKVKELLQKVSNSAPNYERQLKLLQDELNIRRQESAMYEKKINGFEEERKEMYLLMFKKGQQAANMEIKDDRIMDAMTEDRVTLKFLHDAFYYYLLNRGDSQEHLQVMMTILGFTTAQKSEIANRKRGRSN